MKDNTKILWENVITICNQLFTRADVEDSPSTLLCCYAAFCSQSPLAQKICPMWLQQLCKACKPSFSLFLPSTSSGQFVFFPRQNCSLYRHSFAEILAHCGGGRASHACPSRVKPASLRAPLARLPWQLLLQDCRWSCTDAMSSVSSRSRTCMH